MRIAVAGAGIGGLAAALALSDVGCGVDVYERAEALGAVGAGVQLSPSAAMVLGRLGVLDELGAPATALAEVVMRRARDAAVLARVPLGSTAEKRYGAPSLVAMRADLQAALLRAAERRPALALHLGRGVAGYARAASGVVLALSDGSEAAAEGLVGADGLRSAVRRQMTGAGGLRSSRSSAFRAVVPPEAAEADALLPRTTLWLGPGAHLVHYPVAGGAGVNVVAIVEDGGASPDEGGWSEPAEPAAVRTRFAGWAAPARRLVAAPARWQRWRLFDAPPLPRWSDGPATLLGDAAHPMLPFLAQGAAQAIEDAAVLAVSVAASGGDVPAAFAGYEAARRPRTSRVQAASRRQGGVYHLGPPASAMRDLVLRSLGPSRLAARVDWLYTAPADVARFARSERDGPALSSPPS